MDGQGKWSESVAVGTPSGQTGASLCILLAFLLFLASQRRAIQNGIPAANI